MCPRFTMRRLLRHSPLIVCAALRVSSMSNEPESPQFPEEWLSDEH